MINLRKIDGKTDMRSIVAGVFVLPIALVLAPVSAQAVEYKCIYVAKKRGGVGDRVPNTRSVGVTHYKRIAPRGVKISKRKSACNTALFKCNSKLVVRKLQGLNPKAKCVYARSIKN